MLIQLSLARRALRHCVAAVFGALLLANCSSDDPGGSTVTPTRSITLVAGNNQTGLWGDATAIRPSVRVADTTGQPVSGVTVSFSAIGAANGTVSGATQTTGADGIATVGSWTLGTPGTNVLTASAETTSGSPLQFVATSKDRLVLVRTTPTGLSAHIGTAVDTPPGIQISGFFSQAPIAGETVTFTVTTGNGSVTGAVVTTNSQGVASVGSWTLGPVPGANQVTATITWPSSPSITFSATGTP